MGRGGRSLWPWCVINVIRSIKETNPRLPSRVSADAGSQRSRREPTRKAARVRRGEETLYHSDGNLWPVLGDYKAAGVEGINPLEPLSRMYAGDVHKAYPDWILMGGIDVSQLLPFGTEEEVREAVRRTIREAGSGGRLWLGSSTEIHPAANLRNVLAMWDEALAVGYYE